MKFICRRSDRWLVRWTLRNNRDMVERIAYSRECATGVYDLKRAAEEVLAWINFLKQGPRRKQPTGNE